MRLVQVTVPAGKRNTVLEVLDEEGIDYVLTDETSGREYTGVVYFPLPTNAVEPMLGKLRDVGLDEGAYTVVMEAETVISRDFEELTDRYAESEETDQRIAREELTATARGLTPTMDTFLLMSVISAVVAAAGLLLDSPAVVVGSMVIAPLIGPAMAAAVGTVVDDNELFVRGVKLQIVGGLATVASAAAFALLVKEFNLVQFTPAELVQIGQFRERLAPDVLSLAVALGAGVAGAVSLSTGVSTALVGVMIAVALVPPAAAVGIGIAWGLPMVVVGSGVLTLVNVLSINLAAMVVLWYSGYRPTRWFRLDEARTTTLKRAGVLLLAIAVLSVFLGGVTYDSYQTATNERKIHEQVNEIVGSTDAQVFDITIRYGEGIVFRDPQRVVVTVGVPLQEPPPDLGSRLAERIHRVAGSDVEVQVRYVQYERLGGENRSG